MLAFYHLKRKESHQEIAIKIYNWLPVRTLHHNRIVPKIEKKKTQISTHNSQYLSSKNNQFGLRLL